MLKNARVMMMDLFAAKLGLTPMDDYALSVIRSNISPEKQRQSGAGSTLEWMLRGSGRTTRMLLSALVDVAAGKSVHIISASPDAGAEIVERLRGWAKTLDLEPCNVTVGGEDSSIFDRESAPADVIHIDHPYVGRPADRMDYARKAPHVALTSEKRA